MPILIDTDGGEDDLLALAMAVKSGSLEAITTVAGSFPIENASGNVRGLLRIMKADTPVYKGASKPLVRPLVTCQDLHPSVSGRFPSYDGGLDAAPAISAFSKQKGGKIICLGPLTNMADAIDSDESIISTPLFIMGGGFEYNNWPPHLPRHQRTAEYNMFVDPEAAKVVLERSQRVTLVPADVTHNTRWGDYGFSLERTGDTELFYELYQRHSSPLYDPVAVAVALYPDIGQYEVTGVNVDCGHYRGNTSRKQGSNVRLCTGIDADKFFRVFNRLLRSGIGDDLAR